MLGTVLFFSDDDVCAQRQALHKALKNISEDAESVAEKLHGLYGYPTNRPFPKEPVREDDLAALACWIGEKKTVLLQNEQSFDSLFPVEHMCDMLKGVHDLQGNISL